MVAGHERTQRNSPAGFSLFLRLGKTGTARGKHTHFSCEPVSFEGISGHFRPCHGYLRVAISSPHLALHGLEPSFSGDRSCSSSSLLLQQTQAFQAD
ncbi:hypothetical protein DVH24_030378 [Malus domestica]|uniref:Uncharacterized protein n=1 Tax=Malus domestica TaxID=3750 RepID=A0A498K2Q4_MALDO|nr:hypothetical protein DVH24_030378 [Malus domestica]